MRIAVLQRNIIWGDPAANRHQITETLARCEKADLYILPEMFSTGFCVRPQEMAESMDSPTLSWLKETAMRLDGALMGSLLIQENNCFYNRLCFVKPDGEVTTYDKRHLFTFAGEDKAFTAGTRRVIVTYKGMRILLQICYDLRFPVFSRNNNDYDMAVYVANWPTPRAEAWKILLRARAIENQCYVVGVNRVGRDPFCGYSGDSAILDAYGRTIAACPAEKECEAYATLTTEELEKLRRKFPALDDRDDFSLL
ncbi:MAG: amidohydrolase [Porphyromonadaceae bacterium]|nr:amidohydrolase [Porphyromonadaceae bacterium]